MSTPRTWIALTTAGLAFCISSQAPAQWSSDPSQNLVVADGASDQVQLKIAPTSDGGFYVSWFDGIASGFDVRLQRLDAEGDEVWAHNGILVADRSFSSTQDYDLAVDASNHALLVYRSTNSQVTASRVTPAGAVDWSADLVASGSPFVAAPKIAPTTDGFIVAAWTQDSDAALMKLDSNGVMQWPSPTIISDAGGQNFSPSDLVPSLSGSVFLSMVRYGGFADPRQLYAQRIDFAGAPVFASPVAVLDSGSLQFGNFPEIVNDGAGGAVFAWYTNSPTLQCSVQHVFADGTQKFVQNGLAVSTNATRLRVSPSVDYIAAVDEIAVFWTETNSMQSQFGLYGQLIATNGARLWGDAGLAVAPLGSDSIDNVTTTALDGDAVVAWIQSPAFGNDPIFAARYDSAGSAVWSPSPIDVSTVASGKSRIDAAVSADGFIAYVWQDDRTDSGDGYAQNVNPDGSLGPAAQPEDLTGDGVVNADDLFQLLGAWGACGGCPEDLNGDGVVNADDLFQLLGAWG